MTVAIAPAASPEPPRKPSKVDEILDRLLRDIGPGWLLAALVAVLGTILGLVAIVSPYIAGAGAILSGIAAIVRAWRRR